MTKVMQRNIIIAVCALVLAACAIIFPIGAAFGWFEHRTETDKDVPVTGFDVTTTCAFEQDDGTKTPVTMPISINLIDPTATNYLGRLRVSVTVTGNFDAMLRVHFVHLWAQGGTSPSRANVNFAFDSNNFINNTSVDSCYYYCDKATYASLETAGEDTARAYTLKEGDTRTFDLITGLDQATAYENNLELTLIVQSDLVQANRVTQGWDTTLPTP